jgi:hypothetical protein
MIVPSILVFVGGNEKGVAYPFIWLIGVSIEPILAAFILKAGNSALPFFIFRELWIIGILLSVCIHE